MDEFKDEWYDVQANQGSEVKVPVSLDIGRDCDNLKVHVDALMNVLSTNSYQQHPDLEQLLNLKNKLYEIAGSVQDEPQSFQDSCNNGNGGISSDVSSDTKFRQLFRQIEICDIVNKYKKSRKSKCVVSS